MARKFVGPSGDSVWSYRVRIASVEAKFGSGNFDDAGDEMIRLLRETVVEGANLPCEFEFESISSNPSQRFLVFKVRGLSEESAQAMKAVFDEVFGD